MQPQESLEETILRKQMIHQNYMHVFPDRRIPNEELECVWVLSTGRCGTATITDLLMMSPDVLAYHEPQPRIWKHTNEGFCRRGEQRDGMLDVTIDAIRRDAIEIANCYGFLYAECNHRFVFFVNEIARVFPRSRFIYLFREMVPVVKSGYTRGWYGKNDLYREGRPKPRDGIERDRGQMLAWYWCETHKYILDFLEGIDRKRWFYFPFSHISKQDIEGIREMYEWLGVSPVEKPHIKAILGNKTNASPREFVGKKTWEDYGYGIRAAQIVGRILGATRHDAA